MRSQVAIQMDDVLSPVATELAIKEEVNSVTSKYMKILVGPEGFEPSTNGL
jgi:hypothetical protein